ncbi:hypothetical protein MYCTH_2108166 [Thermothelomyces thermophilus ATCC 42464]|uniref:Uncharacterized protein n=1 Tax=Thermothelomyces thermophilus (strain ATCC 42464 / BCRC 31852 / DSM 1799) TaxID=573729 RepID=G2Q659_THET4|nr:uncharacterized protein MYCTH_2108166 [Thermothelomyces thermophilus ATCC 42464]AEO55538.1 hypothetical protein MYCTH_2108166 [Thermothelomyces thermophilus ATCC 42464]
MVVAGLEQAAIAKSRAAMAPVKLNELQARPGAAAEDEPLRKYVPSTRRFPPFQPNVVALKPALRDMQQEAYSDSWMYKYPDDDPEGAAWHRTRKYPNFQEFIPWTTLMDEAEHAYHWVSNQPGAWTKGGPTKNGACLVSALFVPRPDGGCIFFSTIGRGKRANEIMVLKNPREWAPTWLAANDGRPNAIHCEDGSCYDFEKYNSGLPASYDIASHMSGLSIGAGKPSAGAPKQTGLSKGQPSTNNVFTAFQDIGQGEVDSHGNPVYYVSVNIYGMTIDQRQYFCFNSEGNPFNKPPEVSEKDPNPARASKLYKLAKALYSGKMAAASTLHDHHVVPQTHHDLPTQNYGHALYGHDGGAYPHHDNSTTNRPSTASSGSSGGSGGEYTTRPESQTGTTGISASYASVPRTAAYGQHSGAHYDAAPSSRPSSRDGAYQDQPQASTMPKGGPAGGGGPSQTPAASNPAAAQKAPSPPRKVKLDVPKSKSKKSFTVHGIDKGKPYIKGVDGDKDDQHYEVSYSDKYNRFYISTGQSRKDRVYLTAV